MRYTMTAQRAVFLAPDLCKAAGIKPATLRTWHARGYFVIEKDHEREWTRYDRPAALRVLVLAALVRAGLEPKVAARYAATCDPRAAHSTFATSGVTITVSLEALALALEGA